MLHAYLDVCGSSLCTGGQLSAAVSACLGPAMRVARAAMQNLCKLADATPAGQHSSFAGERSEIVGSLWKQVTAVAMYVHIAVQSAEAAFHAATRAQLTAERAQLAVKRAQLEAERAQLAVERAQLAAEVAQLEAEGAQVAALLSRQQAGSEADTNVTDTAGSSTPGATAGNITSPGAGGSSMTTDAGESSRPAGAVICEDSGQHPHRQDLLTWWCMFVAYATYSSQLMHGIQPHETVTEERQAARARAAGAAPDGGGGGSAGAGNSGGDSSTGITGLTFTQLAALADPDKAWAFACSRHLQLPPSHDLLRLVGCSSRSILWSAAAATGFRLVEGLDVERVQKLVQPPLGVVLQDYQLISERVDSKTLMIWSQQDSEDITQQQAELQPRSARPQHVNLHQLHLLMPTLLLYYAAHLPADPIITLPCIRTAKLAMCESAKLVQSGGSSAQQCDEVAGGITADVQLAVTQDVLSLAVCIGDRLRAEMLDSSSAATVTTTTATTAAAAAGTSSTSSLASPTASSTHPADLACEILATLKHMAATTGSRNSAGSASSAAVIKAWSQHAVKVGRLLEAAIRHKSVTHRTGQWRLIQVDMTELVTALCSITCDGGVCIDGPLLQAACSAGPASRKQQQQLFGTLCSALKAAAAADPASSQADTVCLTTACAALKCIAGAVQPSPSAPSQPPPDPELSLMWLALLGRCFFQQEARIKRIAGRTTPAGGGALEPSSVDDSAGDVHRPLYLTQMVELLAGFNQPNAAPAFAAAKEQLAAAGFLVDTIEELRTGLVDVGSLTECAPASATQLPQPQPPAQLLLAAEMLEALGQALNNLPFPHACNNPSCTNLAGPSEKALVAGRSTVCSKDRTARYCSKACQVAHWPQHRAACKALTAAKASTTAAAAAAGPQ